jgi:hypothetical protein
MKTKDFFKMVINFNIIRLFLPVFVYYLLNYLIVIFLKDKIGFSNYGQIGILLSYSALFQTFIMFGYNNGVDLIVLNNQNWNSYIDSIFKLVILFTILTIIILFLFNELNILMFISLIHSIFFLFVGIYKAKTTALGNYKKSAIIQLANVIFSTLLTFVLYFYIQDFKWRIIFLIFSDISIILFFFREDFLIFFKKTSFKSIFIFNYNIDIKFYLFIVLHGLFSFFYSNFDRIFIAKKTTLFISGQYWYYLQLTLPILVLGEVLVRYKIKDLYSDIIINYLQKYKFQINVFSIFFVILFSFFYFTNNTAIIIILCGQLMNALYLPLSSIMFSKKKSNYILFFTIFISIVQFSIYYFFNLNSMIIFSKVFCFLSMLRTYIYWMYIINIMKNEQQHNLQVI